MQLLEDISQSLYSDSDGSMSHVRISSLLNGVIVEIYNSVEIAGANLGNLDEPLNVEGLGLFVDKSRERN